MSRFTKEDLQVFAENNKVTVELEYPYAIYVYELNRACTPQQLVASLRSFANEIEEAIGP